MFVSPFPVASVSTADRWARVDGFFNLLPIKRLYFDYFTAVLWCVRSWCDNYWRNSYQPAAGRGGDGTPGDPHPTEPGALPLPLPVSRPSRPGRSFLSSSLETLQGPSGFLPRVWDAHQPGGRPCLSTQGGMTRDGAQNSRVRTLTHTRMHTHTFTHTLMHKHICTHSHAHTHIHSHTLMHAMHTHILARTVTHTLMHTQSHTHTHAHTLMHTHAHILAHTHTCTLTHTRTHTCTQTHSHTHAHIHIHIFSQFAYSHIHRHTHSHTLIHAHTHSHTTLVALLRPALDAGGSHTLARSGLGAEDLGPHQGHPRAQRVAA